MPAKKEYPYKRNPGNITIEQMKRLVGFADSTYAEVSAEIGVTRAYIPRKVNEDLRRRKAEEERILKEEGRRERVPSEHVTEALDARFEPIVKRIIEDPGFWNALDFVLCRALRCRMLVPAVKGALEDSAFAEAIKAPEAGAERLQLAAIFAGLVGSGEDAPSAGAAASGGVLEFLSFLSDNGIDPAEAAGLHLDPEDGRKAAQWLEKHHADFGAFASFVQGPGYKAWKRDREKQMVEIMKIMKQKGITLADLGKAGAAAAEDPGAGASGSGKEGGL